MFAAGRNAAFRAARVAVPLQQVRHLNLHEFQSKDLLAKHGIYVQQFRVVKTQEEALPKAKEMKLTEKAQEYVVKAQIHAGGRGKGHFDNGFKGGVHVVKKPEEAASIAGKMLGHKLITKQTPPEGVPVKSVMIAEAIDIEEEKYLAIVMDRQHGGPVVVASPAGGMDIEEVAHKTPEKLTYEPIDITVGVKPAQAKRLAEFLKFKTAKHTANAQEQIKKLYNMFLAVDASQIEVNPFGTIADGRVVCFDAKMNFDDNASFRQKDIFAMHDTAEDDPRETEAAKFGLNYVGMDGNIGCMVNGAGLAMATMDIIKLYGGEPANFLDVGGGATERQVTEAFKILTADPKVKAILVNIFGGIMKCDIIAQGVVNAAKQVGLKLPLVVRLAGTNVEKGKEILEKSGVRVVAASDLDDAARKAVATLPK